MKYSFRNDYSEGAHPRILEALGRTNPEQTDGYGTDPHCEHARTLIARHLEAPDADIHFLVGGTQANLTVIAAALRPYQAVIAADTGHISVHETGAIEATGHKVLAQPSPDGKLTPAMIQAAVDAHPNEHMVQPGMVYLSNSTEIGTIYTKEQLEEISECCLRNRLLLFLDGARLSSALTAEGSGLSLSDLARLCDAFYIGGTKCGAMFGEAVVLTNDALKRDFRYLMKQRGGLLAKGRLLGIQFECLFEDDLYFDLGRRANALSLRLRDGLSAAGIRMLSDSPTNQQFPILPDVLVAALAEDYAFETERKLADGRTAIRLVTSWATPESAVEAFLADFQTLIRR